MHELDVLGSPALSILTRLARLPEGKTINANKLYLNCVDHPQENLLEARKLLERVGLTEEFKSTRGGAKLADLRLSPLGRAFCAPLLAAEAVLVGHLPPPEEDDGA